MSDLVIREATIDDAAVILQFVKELAIYEKAEHEVIASEQDIKDSIFSPESTVYALIAERDNQAIAFAVYFFNYSTWLGRRGLYLEDFYVKPSERGQGSGKQLFKYLAQIAVKQGCSRFEWSVLDWNEPAIKFYESVKAEAQKEWISFRLSDQALISFSES